MRMNWAAATAGLALGLAVLGLMIWPLPQASGRDLGAAGTALTQAPDASPAQRPRARAPAAPSSCREGSAGGRAGRPEQIHRSSAPVPDIDEMSRDRSRCRHDGRDQMGAALVALAALEIAVRGRGAAFAGHELVGVHGQ